MALCSLIITRARAYCGRYAAYAAPRYTTVFSSQTAQEKKQKPPSPHAAAPPAPSAAAAAAAGLPASAKAAKAAKGGGHDHASAVPRAADGEPAREKLSEMAVLRQIAAHIWPADSKELKARVVVSVALLVAAKVEFAPGLSVPELAMAIDRVEERIRASTPISQLIYLEPDLYRTTEEESGEGPSSSARPSRSSGSDSPS